MFKKTLKLTIAGTLTITLVSLGYFQTFQKPLFAQSANPQFRVTCAPDKQEVGLREKVTWTATVTGASTSDVNFRWEGDNLSKKTTRVITSKYNTPGRKDVQVAARLGDVTVTATCSVNVKININLPNLGGTNNTGGQQQGGNQLGGTQQGGTNNTGGQQQGGNQLGGTQQGGTNNTGGQQQGGNNAGRNTNNRSNGLSQFSEDVKKCEEGGTIAGIETTQMANAEALQNELQTELVQQMVPTNPIPIVKPIESIRDNIQLLIDKEVGDPTASTPSRDTTLVCTTYAKIKAIMQQAVNEIATGGEDGGPKFHQNLKRLSINTENEVSDAYIEELANANKCGDQTLKRVATKLAKYQASASLLQNASSQTCTLQNSNDKYDLGKFENYMAFNSPENSPFLKTQIAFYEEQKIVGNAVGSQAYKVLISDGLKDEEDEDGNTINPAVLWAPQFTYKFNAAVGSLINADEIDQNPEKLLAEFLNKSHLEFESNSSPSFNTDIEEPIT